MKKNSIVAALGILAAIAGVVLWSILNSAKVSYAFLPQSTTTARPTTCSLYTLKSRAEMGIADNGSFAIAQTLPGGQTNWTQLTSIEINYIKSLNVNSTKSWNWAAQSVGTVYLSVQGYSTDNLVDWPGVVASSEDTNNRNEICIAGTNPDGSANIIAMPQSSSYDQYKTIAWVNQRLYASYAGHPLLWIMPLFDPTSGYKVSKGNTYFAINRAWLYQKIGDIPIPWMQSVTPTATFSSPTLTPTLAPPTITPTQTLTPNPVVTTVTVSNRGAGKYLSIRPGDTTSNVAVGFFFPGTQIPLQKIVHNGNDYWGKDGNGYWVALLLNGTYYTDWRP